MWLPGTQTASIIKKGGGKGNGLVAVAIEKDNKGSRHALKWAADTLLSRGQTLVLIHVSHTTSPSREAILCNINTNSPPASPHVNTTKDLFRTFHSYCSRKDIQCLDVLIEDIDVVKGITEYVSYAAIENLVLGQAYRHSFIRFKSSTPSNILKGAPDFCTVYVISKGRISSVRSAARTAPHASPLLRHIQFLHDENASESEIYSKCISFRADDMGPQPSFASKAIPNTATDSTQKTSHTHKSAEAIKGKAPASEAARARAAPPGVPAAKPGKSLKRTQPPSYRTALEGLKKAKVVPAPPLTQQVPLPPVVPQKVMSAPTLDSATQSLVVTRVSSPPPDSSFTRPGHTHPHSSTGNLWEKGVTGELFKIAKAPAHLLEARHFGDDYYEELGRIEENAFKCASLIQTFSTLQHKYIVSVEELNVSREENKKIQEELLSAQAESKKFKEELLAENKQLREEFLAKTRKLKEELLASQIANTSLMSDLGRAQGSLEAAEQREAQLTVSYNDLKVVLEDKVRASEAQIASMGDTLASTVEEAFNNTLEQVRCLNPDIEFITAGMHYLSYVKDGKIIPPSLPEDSAVPMNEDPTPGEEATSTIQPDNQPPPSEN